MFVAGNAVANVEKCRHPKLMKTTHRVLKHYSKKIVSSKSVEKDFEDVLIKEKLLTKIYIESCRVYK